MRARARGDGTGIGAKPGGDSAQNSGRSISDGFTDAQNPKQEMFGEQRMRQIIRREAPAGGHAIEQKFLQAVNEFTKGMTQTDDITFVVVEKYE
jgi:serine phosphatase RsbU (regulator of sigma subunit)